MYVNLLTGSHDGTRVILRPSDPDCPMTPASWMTPQMAAHYMRYAAACYGWSIYNAKSCFSAAWAMFKVILHSR